MKKSKNHWLVWIENFKIEGQFIGKTERQRKSRRLDQLWNNNETEVKPNSKSVLSRDWMWGRKGRIGFRALGLYLSNQIVSSHLALTLCSFRLDSACADPFLNRGIQLDAFVQRRVTLAPKYRMLCKRVSLCIGITVRSTTEQFTKPLILLNKLFDKRHSEKTFCRAQDQVLTDHKTKTRLSRVSFGIEVLFQSLFNWMPQKWQ